MTHFLVIGTVLGLSAGFAPGPLLTLVISETLQRDIKSGVKVAVAPIITDIPIIVLTLFVLSKLSNFHNILGIISLIGGCLVLFMGYENIRTRKVDLNSQEGTSKSFSKGVLVNALNPQPYLFWFSVGAPITVKAMSVNTSAPVAFLFSFYFFLVGAKVVLAIVVGKYKSLLKGKIYIYTLRFLGILLCLLAIILFNDGFQLLK